MTLRKSLNCVASVFPSVKWGLHPLLKLLFLCVKSTECFEQAGKTFSRICPHTHPSTADQEEERMLDFCGELLNASVLFGDEINLCLFLSQARAGIISTVEVLKVMEAFVNEPNYTVWSDLSCNLGILSTLLSHTDFYEEIQVFVKDVFSPIGERLGWDPKPGEGRRY